MVWGTGPEAVGPACFPPSANAEIKALACQLPAITGVPLSRWSCAELAREVIIRGVVVFTSPPPSGAKREHVISSDEKTSIQVRCRCHPTLPPGKARLMRVEHEYDRSGALAYLAACDAYQARPYGRSEPTTGIEPAGRPAGPAGHDRRALRLGPSGVLGGRQRQSLGDEDGAFPWPIWVTPGGFDIGQRDWAGVDGNGSGLDLGHEGGQLGQVGLGDTAPWPLPWMRRLAARSATRRRPPGWLRVAWLHGWPSRRRCRSRRGPGQSGPAGGKLAAEGPPRRTWPGS